MTKKNINIDNKIYEIETYLEDIGIEYTKEYSSFHPNIDLSSRPFSYQSFLMDLSEDEYGIKVDKLEEKPTLYGTIPVTKLEFDHGFEIHAHKCTLTYLEDKEYKRTITFLLNGKVVYERKQLDVGYSPSTATARVSEDMLNNSYSIDIDGTEFSPAVRLEEDSIDRTYSYEDINFISNKIDKSIRIPLTYETNEYDIELDIKVDSNNLLQYGSLTLTHKKDGYKYEIKVSKSIGLNVTCENKIGYRYNAIITGEIKHIIDIDKEVKNATPEELMILKEFLSGVEMSIIYDKFDPYNFNTEVIERLLNVITDSLSTIIPEIPLQTVSKKISNTNRKRERSIIKNGKKY